MEKEIYIPASEWLHIWELSETLSYYTLSPIPDQVSSSLKGKCQWVHCHYSRIFPTARLNQQHSVTNPLFSLLYCHDPLFRIIWAPQFHKASFYPDVNLNKYATWELNVAFRVSLEINVFKKGNKNLSACLSRYVVGGCICVSEWWAEDD